MLDFFNARIPAQMNPGAAEGALKVATEDGFACLDSWLEGKTFFCGDRCTIADLRLFCMYKFFNKMAGGAGFMSGVTRCACTCAHVHRVEFSPQIPVSIGPSP